jgi:hypothetical protein
MAASEGRKCRGNLNSDQGGLEGGRLRDVPVRGCAPSVRDRGTGATSQRRRRWAGEKSRREDQEPGGWDGPSSRGAKPRGQAKGPLSRRTLKTRGEARARRLRLGACPPIGLVARQWRVATSQAPGPCVRGKSPFVSTCLARRLARGTRTGPCRLQRDEAEIKGPPPRARQGHVGLFPRPGMAG